ncbi:MAG: universal stress protein, partial [Sphingomonadaceae bacterium]
MQLIMVGMDFSPQADRALRRATLLARATGARLCLVHACDREEPQPPATLSEAKERLAGMARALDAEGLDADTACLAGSPEAALPPAALAHGADLLVLGPHRQQPLKDLFVSATAGRILRRSEVPVLLSLGVPAGPWQRILVASDLSDSSAHALALVGREAALHSGELRLFHAFEPLPHGFMTTSGMTVQERQDEIAALRRKAEKGLAAQAEAAGLGAAERQVQPLLHGPAESILQAAADMRADLVVVGTRGASGLERFILGSVADAVLRQASMDVLAVPPGAT